MTILISGDVECSGPCPGLGDLVSFGLVVIEPGLTRRFASGVLRAECEFYEEPRYDIIGITRQQHETAEKTIAEGVAELDAWIRGLDAKRCVLVSDNPSTDAMWLMTEMHKKLGMSHFGHSARRIGDAYAGLRQRPRDTSGWKRYRVTPHTHDPLDDAVGNAEAWIRMWELHGETKEAKGAGMPKAAKSEQDGPASA